MSKRTNDKVDGAESNALDSTKKTDTQFSKENIESFFNQQIWDKEFQNNLTQEVRDSQPYRWGTIRTLMDDTLLRQVRKEVLSEIAFTKKETDIYKVFQSGDLANLSGLDWDDLSRLPSLFRLRSAIYSEEFRDVISKVTGCGKLSGVKTDMSINTYTKGCHLLTHDDVIGSRRVSFILYLPDPDRTWEAKYGGGLRLFPAIVPNVPKTDFHTKLVPQFNQIAFFTVQPGLSFHDVEEVRVDKQRLSIQGWFHIPQPDEPGYIPGEQAETEAKSTLQQLQTKELQEFDFPKPFRADISPEDIKEYEGIQKVSDLTDADVKYLAKFINPSYLLEKTLTDLSKVFEEESVVEMHEILNKEYASLLKKLIRTTEVESKTPATSDEIHAPWKCAIPPHKQRFMYMDGKLNFKATQEEINFVNHIGPQEAANFEMVSRAEGTSDDGLVALAAFFRSAAFRKWLKLLTSLIVTTDQVLVRRFRPGQDFILATTTDKHIARNEQELDVLLEATLNLTPTKDWESGEYGGYELCMALSKGDDEDDSDFEEDDDPAVYKSSGPDDDSVLYTSQCKWNSLTLMLRDPSVLKFVKYVSINAKGSRWDLSCQWNVKENL